MESIGRRMRSLVYFRASRPVDRKPELEVNRPELKLKLELEMPILRCFRESDLQKSTDSQQTVQFRLAQINFLYVPPS